MKVPGWLWSWLTADRLPVLTFVVASVVALVTVLLFHQRLGAREELRDRLAREVASLAQDQARIQEKTQLYERYGPAYAKAERQGWWRTQDRLAWVEEVDSAARRARLVGLRYTLSPARPVLDEGEFRVRSVGVGLEIGLVHGEQLLAFQRTLAGMGLGSVSWEQCRIERRQQPAKQNEANLVAACRLEWFAILHQAAGEDENDAGDSADHLDFPS